MKSNIPNNASGLLTALAAGLGFFFSALINVVSELLLNRIARLVLLLFIVALRPIAHLASCFEN